MKNHNFSVIVLAPTWSLDHDRSHISPLFTYIANWFYTLHVISNERKPPKHFPVIRCLPKWKFSKIHQIFSWVVGNHGRYKGYKRCSWFLGEIVVSPWQSWNELCMPSQLESNILYIRLPTKAFNMEFEQAYERSCRQWSIIKI